jgi:KDO2-lipid IV(A) lauroyltransferase
MEKYPFSLVLRDPRDEMLAKTLRDLRSNVGIESIPVHPRKACIAQSLACLKRNEILFLQIDQNASSQDLWVDFFGWQVPTFKGPVVFSMRTGAPLIPMFIVRDSSGQHQLTIKPPFTLTKTDNQEDDILQNTASLTKLIEGYIEQYPTQWWWFHRRWKKARKSN